MAISQLTDFFGWITAKTPSESAMSRLSRLERSLSRLLKECGLRLACITRGDRGGSLIVSDETAVEHQGFHVKVVDAVGAGDAFTEFVAHHYMRGKPLQEISESANRFVSWVATQAWRDADGYSGTAAQHP